MHSEGHQPSERRTTEKPLTFTWVNARSKEERSRIIHRHAMKEIGKTRRRPKKPMTFELDISALNDKNQTPCFPLPDVQPSWWLGLRLTAGIGWLDPFVSYPVPIDASSRVLIANGEWVSLYVPYTLTCRHVIMAGAKGKLCGDNGREMEEKRKMR